MARVRPQQVLQGCQLAQVGRLYAPRPCGLRAVEAQAPACAELHERRMLPPRPRVLSQDETTQPTSTQGIKRMRPAGSSVCAGAWGRAVSSQPASAHVMCRVLPRWRMACEMAESTEPPGLGASTGTALRTLQQGGAQL